MLVDLSAHNMRFQNIEGQV